MKTNQKVGRYERLYAQIETLLKKSNNPYSNMATIVAILHHKMECFFWTGFYLLNEGKLQVGPYQGSLACIDLPENTGVCRKGMRDKKPVVVPDVHQFPSHIACDSRSNSEIVIPVFDKNGRVVGVLDVDSDQKNSFDDIDTEWLTKIISLVF